jgi:phospholipase/carboxylesterase
MTRPLHLILLHGLGADGDDLAPVSDHLVDRVALPDHQWQVYRPDAPVAPVSINGGLAMPSWFDLIDDNGQIDVDRDSLARTTATLTAEVEERVGDDPWLVGGFSQGGVLATRLTLGARRPPLAAILLSTWLAAPEQIEKPSDGRNPAVFIGHGRHDPLVPVHAAGKLNAFLQDCGLTNVTERHYPVEHGILPQELDDIAAWLSRRMNDLSHN